MEEQDLSRTEFDSCDQYSMAAEKDSGRSDVSDIGSDNVSLADEEQQTPRDCPGHRSLRTAALSFKLLRNQEADQHSARLFVQSLAELLPRLLGLATATEVDVSLQNFSSTFCSGLQAGERGGGRTVDLCGDVTSFLVVLTSSKGTDCVCVSAKPTRGIY